MNSYIFNLQEGRKIESKQGIRKQQYDRFKPNYINNHIKYRLFKIKPNQLMQPTAIVFKPNIHSMTQTVFLNQLLFISCFPPKYQLPFWLAMHEYPPYQTLAYTEFQNF